MKVAAGRKYQDFSRAIAAFEIFQFLNEPVFITNLKREVLAGNRAFFVFAGVSVRHFHEPVALAHFLSFKDPARDVIARAAAEGQAVNEREVLLLDSTGAERSVTLGVVPLMVDTGEAAEGPMAAGFLVNLQDKTDELTAHNKLTATIEELKRKNKEAMAAVIAKTEFIATVSHELRTPMNGVLGMAELLLDTPLNPEQLDFVETIKASGDSLLMLINDILDFSKIDAGKMQLEAVEFDFKQVIQDVVRLIHFKAQEKDLEISHYIPTQIGTRVIGDPGRIRQVLTNFLGNAMKFTAKGSIIVIVTPLDKQEGFLKLRFDVKDTGIGIPEDKLGRLFKAFSQVDTSTTRQYGGTGLGLAICKNLVNLMGGEIGVESRLGKGSTFWFTVPFKTVEGKQVEASVLEIDLKGRRAIIVDDMPDVLKLYGMMLESWGMAGETASDGPEALDLIRRRAAEGRPFDIAIIDLVLREMNGDDLAIKLKADPLTAALPLVMITGVSAARGDAQRMHDIGFEAYLTKPVTPSQILETLARVLGHKPQAAAAAPLITKHVLTESRGSLHILVVEDNPINLKVITRMLQKAGHECGTASNGREGVDNLFARHYDLVLMDMQMPVLDGLGAAREIRAREKGLEHVPIVALTANVTPEDRVRCSEAGMDDFLTKPIVPERLMEALEKWGAKAKPAFDTRRKPTIPV